MSENQNPQNLDRKGQTPKNALKLASYNKSDLGSHPQNESPNNQPQLHSKVNDTQIKPKMQNKPPQQKNNSPVNDKIGSEMEDSQKEEQGETLLPESGQLTKCSNDITEKQTNLANICVSLTPQNNLTNNVAQAGISDMKNKNQDDSVRIGNDSKKDVHGVKNIERFQNDVMANENTLLHTGQETANSDVHLDDSDQLVSNIVIKIDIDATKGELAQPGEGTAICPHSQEKETNSGSEQLVVPTTDAIYADGLVTTAVPVELIPKALYAIEVPEKIVVDPASAVGIDYEAQASGERYYPDEISFKTPSRHSSGEVDNGPLGKMQNYFGLDRQDQSLLTNQFNEINDPGFKLNKIEQFESLEKFDICNNDEENISGGSNSKVDKKAISNNQEILMKTINRSPGEECTAEVIQNDMELIDENETDAKNKNKNSVGNQYGPQARQIERGLEKGEGRRQRDEDCDPHDIEEIDPNEEMEYIQERSDVRFLSRQSNHVIDQMFEDDVGFINGDMEQLYNMGESMPSIEFDWNPPEKFRAKLYNLDGEGRWHDLGTGYFSIVQMENGHYKMKLIQEQNSQMDLLEHDYIMSQNMQFARQRETIITWSYFTNKSIDQDLAVSFQNNSGALYTWQKICQILGMDPDKNSQDSQAQEEEELFTTISIDTVPKMAEELRNLNQLESVAKHEIAERFLENQNVNITKLGELFIECEKDQGSQKTFEYLLCFFQIYKGLILLNDQRLIDTLLSSKYYLHTFGALEWDPDGLIVEEIWNEGADQQKIDIGGQVENSDFPFPPPSIAGTILADENQNMEKTNSESALKDIQIIIQKTQDVKATYEKDLDDHCMADQSGKQEGEANVNCDIENELNKEDAPGEHVKVTEQDEIREDSADGQMKDKEKSVNSEAEAVQGDSAPEPYESFVKVQEEAGTRRQEMKEVQQYSVEHYNGNSEDSGGNQNVIGQGNTEFENSQACQQMSQQKKVLNYREFLQKTVKFKKVVEFQSHNHWGRSNMQKNGQTKSPEEGEKKNGCLIKVQGDQCQLNSSDEETGEVQGLESQNAGQPCAIEEKIHRNYRLQYLRDSVMARYIDDQTVSVINQLITTNNREIVTYVFEPRPYNYSEGLNGEDMVHYRSEKSLKDQIIDKIKNQNDMKSRHQAIEFMIELCQILKSLQFQPGGLGGSAVGSFIYSSGGMGSGVNSRQLYEQLNQINFISLLAESFSILNPCEESLIAHLNKTDPEYKENLVEIYVKQLDDINSQYSAPASDAEYKETNSVENVINEVKHVKKQEAKATTSNVEKQSKVCIINDLIEFKNDRNTFDELQQEGNNGFKTSNTLCDERNMTTRVDSMKINSMEIILSFQQNFHMPMSSINKFLLCSEQHQYGYPFMNQLVTHLIYSNELGLKIQISDFFKAIFDGEQNQMNNVSIKDTFYKEILFKGSQKFLVDIVLIKKNLDTQSYAHLTDQVKYDLYKNYEFSAYLILQILNKVVAEHRYPLTVKIQENNVIKIVADLQQLNSQIVNIEIVKFYKALLRSKNYGYLLCIMRYNLFDPIYRIFEDSYHPKNPPMIYSCIRDLFEMIFRRGHPKQENEYHNAKFVDYLSQDTYSKSVLKNPQYEEVFDKYHLNIRDENTMVDSKGLGQFPRQQVPENFTPDAPSIDSSVSNSPASIFSGTQEDMQGMFRDQHGSRQKISNIDKSESGDDGEQKGLNRNHRRIIRTDRNIIENRYKNRKKPRFVERENSIFDDELDEFGPDYDFGYQDYFPDYRDYQMGSAESFQNPQSDAQYDNDENAQAGGNSSTMRVVKDAEFEDNDGGLSPIGNRNEIFMQNEDNIMQAQIKEDNCISSGKGSSEGNCNSHEKNTSQFLFDLQDDIKEDEQKSDKFRQLYDEHPSSFTAKNDKQVNLRLEVGEHADEYHQAEIKEEPEGEILDKGITNLDGLSQQKAVGQGKVVHTSALKTGMRNSGKSNEGSEDDENEEKYNQMCYEQLMQDNKCEKQKKAQIEFKTKLELKRLQSIEQLNQGSKGFTSHSPKDFKMSSDNPLLKQPKIISFGGSSPPANDGDKCHKKGSTPGQKSYGNSAEISDKYERSSNHSSDMPLSIEEDLAKDCGIFQINLNKQQARSQPTFKQDDTSRQIYKSLSDRKFAQSKDQLSQSQMLLSRNLRRKSFDDQELEERMSYSKIIAKSDVPKNKEWVSDIAGSISQQRNQKSKQFGQQMAQKQSGDASINKFFGSKFYETAGRQNSHEKQKNKIFSENLIERTGPRNGSQSAEKQAYMRQTSKPGEVEHMEQNNTLMNGGYQKSTSLLEIDAHKGNSIVEEIEMKDDDNIKENGVNNLYQSGIKVGVKRKINTHTGLIENQNSQQTNKQIYSDIINANYKQNQANTSSVQDDDKVIQGINDQKVGLKRKKVTDATPTKNSDCNTKSKESNTSVINEEQMTEKKNEQQKAKIKNEDSQIDKPQYQELFKNDI